jgi:hypothetical protein
MASKGRDPMADWSRAEVEAIVSDYLEMLREELAGGTVNKAAHNRALRQVLLGRSAGSIEFKHANISAILHRAGYASIDGYKPRSNYQELLREVVLRRLDSDRQLSALMQSLVEAQVCIPLPAVSDIASIIVPAPRGEDPSLFERPAALPAPRSVNYLEREARNQSLGEAGEKFVLQVEHARLLREGAERWADRIEHVSRTQGDGLGYDILSYEHDGTERLIEVKTTRFGVMTPFFATKHEVDVSEGHGERYHLYRVFRFEREPRLFMLPGSLRQSFNLEATVYRATLP